MIIVNNTCENLQNSHEDFQGHFENPDLYKIEINTQYNCCDNLLFEESVENFNCAKVVYEDLELIDEDLQIIKINFKIVGDTFLPYTTQPLFESWINIDPIAPYFSVNSYTYIDSTHFSITIQLGLVPPMDFNFEVYIEGFGLVKAQNSLSTTFNLVNPQFADFTITQTLSDCELDSDYITIENNTIVIDHSMFSSLNATSLLDGIYNVSITFYFTDGSFETYENCIFVDCQTACKLATYMAANLGKPVATEMAMLHYALHEASLCECECENLCILFGDLWNKLFNTPLIGGCNC